MLKRLHFFLSCCFLFFLGTKNIHAQVVNMEGERFHRDSTTWSGSLTGNLSLSDYGSKVYYVNAGAHVQYQNEKELYLILGNYGILKGDGKKLVDNGFLHFRYNHKIGKVVRWEAFSQIQQNTIINLQSRFLIGTGPRFKIVSSKKVRLYAASLMMYERDKETTNPDVLDEFRSSSYASVTFLPNEYTEITSTTYYQPKFTDIADFRVFNVLNINIKAGKKVSVNIKWNYLYDTRPPGNTQKYNYDFSTGVELKM